MVLSVGTTGVMDGPVNGGVGHAAKAFTVGTHRLIPPQETVDQVRYQASSCSLPLRSWQALSPHEGMGQSAV